MHLRARLPLLLALALVAGQWFAAAHGSDHLQADAAHACAACLSADVAGTGAPAAPAPLQFTGSEAPPPPAAVDAGRITTRRHPIRGPPLLLA